MALNPSAIEAAVAGAVKAELDERFGGEDPPEDPDVIYQDVADAVAAGVRVAVQAIIDNADVTGVTAGSDTVSGAIE